jgi:hypothetical protein
MGSRRYSRRATGDTEKATKPWLMGSGQMRESPHSRLSEIVRNSILQNAELALGQQSSPLFH